MKRLNNLVTELLNLENIPSNGEARFSNPRELMFNFVEAQPYLED